jgi:hypothetical protein
VGRRVALVWTAAGLHGGLVLLLAWQALRGRPLLAPDAATLAALGGLLAAAAFAATAILLPGRGGKSEAGPEAAVAALEKKACHA